MSFGVSFAEEISRSVIAAVWFHEEESTFARDIRISAALTMLESFHPRDQLECMMAAQGTATHVMIMECYARAMRPETLEPLAIKLRANATQMNRMFSLITHDLEKRQLKPLPPRPPNAAPPPIPEGPPRERDMAAETENHAALAEDMDTRPDGTPGSLAAYAPKEPVVPFVPREPVIMMALATRGKPWRQVNGPQATEAVVVEAVEVPVDLGPVARIAGGRDLREKFLTGDALSRFASARLDPDAPLPDLVRDDRDEPAVIEVEVISTGGDPVAEAERAAMMAAHPEGKPIVVRHYGPKQSNDD